MVTRALNIYEIMHCVRRIAVESRRVGRIFIGRGNITARASRLEQMDAAFSFYYASDLDNREGITPPPVRLQHHRIGSENKTPFSRRA